jgi:hypothetical protein
MNGTDPIDHPLLGDRDIASGLKSDDDARLT